MKVKNRFYFAIGVILVVPLAYFIADRTAFILVSETTAGTVERVWGYNDRCGRRRSRYDCTRFRATVNYEVSQRQYQIEVEAGRARGHDQPISAAKYGVGSRERAAFDPKRPYRAYRDTLWDIWGTPIALLFFQVISFFASFAEKRRND